MKYLYQTGIILLVTFLGEVLARVVPFPVPAAVWGLTLLFTLLCLRVIRPGQIGDSARFLLLLLPVLFVSPTVNLMDQGQALGRILPQAALIVVLSTLLTFPVSGRVTQFLRKRTGKEDDE